MTVPGARPERIGGFGGKSDILAQNQTYLGDPGAWTRQRSSDLKAATPANDRDRRRPRKWLTRRRLSP